MHWNRANQETHVVIKNDHFGQQAVAHLDPSVLVNKWRVA
jgi:hypothetical protein